MAIKDLATSSMVTVTGEWVDPKKDRPLIEKLPRVKPLLPDIEGAHYGLLRTQKRGAAIVVKLAELAKEGSDVDEIYDRTARGLFGLFGVLVDLVDDPELSAGLATAQEELFPSGATIVNLTYRDEAGEAALAAERLSPESKKLLKGVEVAGKSLAKWADQWFAAGRRLGEIEAERVALQGQPDETPTAAEMSQARFNWIRVMNLVLQNLEFEKDLDAETRQQLMGNLDDALSKVKRRPRGKSDAPANGAPTKGSAPPNGAPEKAPAAPANGQAAAPASPPAPAADGAKPA